jgi:hypothetical protein
MPAWKWLEFKDFIVDFENKKDYYTVGDVLGTLCTGLHKPVLRIVPKSEYVLQFFYCLSLFPGLLK